MIGRTFTTTATICKDDIFCNFGVTPKLKNVFGVKKDEPIYEVEFEIMEESAVRPKGHTNDFIYYAFCDNGKYSMIQTTAEMFAMQFPWDVWKHQGKLKCVDILGNRKYFGTVVRIEPKSYKEIKDEQYLYNDSQEN